MNITYFGHSAFLLEDLLIDPFLNNNPHTKVTPSDIDCSIICVTHDHQDHIGDTVEIAKKTGAPVIAIHEIAVMLGKEGIKTEGMNIGGWIEQGDWRIQMTDARHSSGHGNPAGFILHHIPTNKKVYHAGDTGLFSDMSFIGEEGIDIALLPIGGRYTMDVDQAVRACEFIKPKLAVPMHFDTFPIIPADPKEFVEKCPCEATVFGFDEKREV